MAKMQKEAQPNMTLEEARAYRASLYKPTKIDLTEEQKREAFRVFWAQQKNKYAKSKGLGFKDLEEILWLHLKSSNLDQPQDFAKGLQNFGLKQVR